MKPGDIVRMNAACKKALFKTGSHDHVKEFGRCVGEVIGPTDYGNQLGPELDVRWKPSNLRYAYAPAHLQLVTMKAFYVWGYEREQGCQLVYAYNGNQARAIAANELDSEYLDTKAERKPEHDARIGDRKVPFMENDARYLRSHGWQHEDEYTCGSCGLAAMGLEEYAVCRTCTLCRECGCEEGCDQSDGFSCE